MLSLVAATGGCPSHSVSAPINATFNTRCVWSTEAASSIFVCVEKCAADGGVPACPNSTAEYAWFVDVIRMLVHVRSHWLGLYQRPGAEEPDGWDRCVSGGGVNFTNWSRIAVADGPIAQHSCAIAYYDGAFAGPCIFQEYLNDSLPCLCTPGNASDEWPHDAEALRQQYAEAQRNTTYLADLRDSLSDPSVSTTRPTTAIEVV
jgi:hypothetical protein